MPDIPTTLKSMDLGALLADGLREATRQPPAAWEPESPEDLAGLLPGYEIIRLIGRGGMGAVYEARQADLGRRVALKILPPELGADEAFAERFRREARALGRLEHENILEVYEFGESAAGHLFFSMQYVEGGDLGARLKQGPLVQGEALRMVKEICAALEAAHAEGIIHRDIKPSNILLTANGSVKVADFGIAVLDDQPRERLTYTGLAVGTLEYAAPEQAAGAAVDTRSDLYSVGVICYEVLTGQLPRGIFDPPSKVNAAVHPAVDSVVHTAMQSDPARRFQTATDFRAALHRTGEKKVHPARWKPLGAAAAVLLAAGAGISQWWPGKTEARPKIAAASLVLGTTVVGWGQNEFGEGRASVVVGDAKAIAAGGYFTVVLKTDGTVVAWGKDERGQTRVPAGLTDVESIACGDSHTVALKSDGTVVAWGYNARGQTAVPADLTGVVAVAAADRFSVALKSDGKLVAWGGDDAQLISGQPELTDLKTVAARGNYLLAVKRDGTVVHWGGGSLYSQAAIPAGLAGVRTVACGIDHCLALKTDGTVVAWGRDDHGQATVPAGLDGVVAISAGVKHSMALKSDGTVVAWGIQGKEAWGNAYGQAAVPAGLTGVKAIAAGLRHSLALR